MKRLRGSDAFAIYSETPTSPFVTLKVGIYRPTNSDDVPGIDEVKQFVLSGVARHIAYAAMRIVRVPFDLHHPLWVADPDFSPENHIFHTRLPAPGDKARLCDLISDLMGRPMNPDRPLWEVWIVDGLEERKIAIVAKLHHALADGNTIAAMVPIPTRHQRRATCTGTGQTGKRFPVARGWFAMRWSTWPGVTRSTSPAITAT